MSGKFSELCRENAQLTSTINGLKKMLTDTQEGIKETHQDYQSKIEEVASNISDMKTEKQPKRGEEESEKLRLMNVSLSFNDRNPWEV